MKEIERKFLIDQKKWVPTGEGLKIKQGYLSVDPERTVRIRVSGEKSWLTVKGKSVGITRPEFEYEIPIADAVLILDLCKDYILEKTRYLEKIGNHLWEIDVFEGENKGLIIAEIELKDEQESFEIPEWIVKEVSGDDRYFNSNLSVKPYSLWEVENN